MVRILDRKIFILPLSTTKHSTTKTPKQLQSIATYDEPKNLKTSGLPGWRLEETTREPEPRHDFFYSLLI